MAGWSIAKLTVRPRLTVVLRYGLAVISVAIALAITLITRLQNSPPRFVSHFVLIAIAITFWCGGTGPGLLALLLSCLGVSFLAMNHFLTPDFPLGSFLSLFVIFSLLMSWFAASRRRAQKVITEARVNLELRVTERTAELRKAFEEIKELRDQLHQENLALKEEIDQASMFEEIVGYSDALREVLTQVERVAPTDSTVLITGETGTGKELIARAIHRRSKRAGQAFVSVNCASIPTSLIASELFGHEKGAFTGALQRRQGRFELAHGGTIFLDEVGELPAETQIALLRVLQERQFERVGGNRVLETDVRVIAATNRDLTAAIGAGTFRADLFYRLNVVPIEVPPLRQRRDDIAVLVEYFVKRYAQKAGKRIKNIRKKTLELFQMYDWPGNVRELQNVIERAVVLSNDDTFVVSESWLKPAPRAQIEGVATDRGLTNVPLVTNLIEHEREIIETALREAEGVVGGPAGAAAKLGIPRETLNSKIRKLGIKRYLYKRS